MGNEPLLYRYNANAEHAGKYGKGAERHGGWVGRDTKQEGDDMNFFTPLVLSSMLLSVLAGCESYALPLGGTNPTIPNAKQGQDCRVHVFGIGGMPDVSGIQAMRSGAISKLRSDEYRANSFVGVGRECVIAYGE
jgi:hypothetical protein